MVILAGGEPVFVDLEDTYNINHNLIEENITENSSYSCHPLTRQNVQYGTNKRNCR